ncbi:MAG TPA: hypothetical protein VJH65_03280 [Candidatus Nanoarchaeia archaeon]|nr:hypothetical protein [Candidatus Nanoarchaeia archaeon]
MMLNKKLIKYKKADVPIIILVLGVFAVCGLVLLSFSISRNNSEEKFAALNLIGRVNSYAEEYNFYKNPEIAQNPEEIMGIFNNPTVKGSSLKISYEADIEAEEVIIRGVYKDTDFFADGKNIMIIERRIKK